MKKMDQLIQSRIIAMLYLDKLQKELEPLLQTAHNTDKYLNLWNDAFKKVSDVHDEIMKICSPEERGDHFDEYMNANRVYLSLLGSFNTTAPVSQVSTPSSTASSSISQPPQPQLKGIQMELPTFSGKYTDWPMFSKLFIENINLYTYLTPLNKLTMLVNSLAPSARVHIAQIQPGPDAFSQAWDALQKKYDNKRAIASSLVSSIVDTSPMSSQRDELAFVDAARQSIMGLTTLKVDMVDLILNHVVTPKLRPSTREAWLATLSRSSLPKFEDLLDFIADKCTDQLTTHPAPHSSKQTFHQPAASRGPYQQRPTQNFSQYPTQKCPECALNHLLCSCPVFFKATNATRWDIVKKLKVCTNCLRLGHAIGSCTSPAICKLCNKRHHTMLHQNAAPKVTAATVVHDDVLLATAMIIIENQHGDPVKLRAFLDPGSQICLISERAKQLLHLPTTATAQTVTAGNAVQWSVDQEANVNIKSTVSDFSTTVKTYVVSKVIADLPIVPLDPALLDTLPQRKKLADPHLCESAPIDVLLGCGVFNAISQKCKEVLPSGLGAYKTRLGWIVYGAYSKSHCSPQLVSAAMAVEPNLHQFWEIEEIKTTKPLTPEEQRVEDFFDSTVNFNENHYEVRLPLVDDPPPLGISRPQAVSRLKTLERKFTKQPEFADDYKAVIHEYIDMGHMVQVPKDIKTDRVCYLPHHAVFKDSTTTALRVVFDASARTSTGNSLNDVQLNGPRLQQDIFAHIVRFRTYEVALTADISKMYRRIQVAEEDQDLQRVVWRDSPSDPVQDYRLTTVTFGQKSAPYLATKSLQHLSKQCPEPLATVIREHFYVDDLLSGSGTPGAAAQLQRSVQHVLLSAGFPTHKWASNCPDALDHLDPSNREIDSRCEIISPDLQIKTLGIQWDTKSDCFIITTSAINNQPSHKLTRRLMLSAANSLYDPLGWLAPITITAKLQIQQLVKDTKNWDDPLNETTIRAWNQWTSSLPLLESLQIPRKCANMDFVLCGFADASEKAYAAVVYAVTTTGLNKVSLVAAKTKVSPLKQPISLPRLELLAALLLAKLLKAIISALPHHPSKIYAWSDSTIALQWVTSAPGKWKTFVANRVVQIQEVIPPQSWNHISSKANPADLPSRGVSSEELLNSSLWWHGPPWLPTYEDHLCKVPPGEPIEEKKPTVCAAIVNPVQPPEIFDIIKQFSSWYRLRKFVARCMKLVRRVREKSSPTNLTVKDFQKAESVLIQSVQKFSFCDEYELLLKQKHVSKQSVLARLNPFIGDHGLLRVGGRIEKSKLLTESQKHPLIMPQRQYITELLVRHYHVSNMHSGLAATESIIRDKYWIVHGRNTIKRLLRTCIPCVKQKGITARQMMASLPSARVCPDVPFRKCGVDFAGPVTLKTQLARGTRHYKSWIALFVCFTTRAIHLELVTSLSTPAFMAALIRFTSRRGTPHELWSDQGTNFKGAANDMAKLLAESSTQDAFAERGIKFHFNPAGAPHFGGLWEAGVKSMKTHLQRSIGLNVFTYEEYSTILCRTEAALNSRPLLPMSDDPTDLAAITPAHFLIQGVLEQPPEEDLTNFKESTLRRWQLVQKTSQDFWRRWSSEYLSRLQQRPKWWRAAPNLTVGTLVLVKDDNVPPMKWNLARITEVHEGSDGLVRALTLKTAHKEITRPAHRLVPLPLDVPVSSSQC